MDTIPHDKLPLGMRLNNPGNMRSAAGPNLRTKLVDGFAQFENLHDGLESLFYQIHMNYAVHGLRTVPAFVGRYAPSSENNTDYYIKAVVAKIGMNPLKVTTMDTRLDQAWRAMDFARAIIAIEQGPTPARWRDGLEWCGPFDMANAMQATGKWASA